MNKALAMILAALAFAAFAVDTNRVTMTRLGSLNPRSGEVVTDVTFEGLADATNVYTKAETEEKIVELAPAPGNYAAVSNAAMSAKTKLSAIFNMDNPTAVPKAVEAQESESASFAAEANKAYNLFAEGEEPESRSSIDIFAAIDATLRKDKQNSDVQIFGGFLSGFGFHADTGHNDNGWNQYTAHNGTALSQPLPAYIGSNPWGFLKQGEAIPTTGGVFNAYIHLNQKFSVGTWTQYVKPIETAGGSGIAFAFGDNVQTRASNTMVLGVGALNTNNWSFVWNGDANRMYVPTQPNISNPYSTRYNGGFHVNPSVRSGMTNPLQNFWIGDTNLAVWISTLAPAETDPTVPQWAKAESKPSYTANEVGAVSTTGDGAIEGELSIEPPTGDYHFNFAKDGFEISLEDDAFTYTGFDNDGVYIRRGFGSQVYFINFPSNGGTFALTSDIPDVPVWALAAQKPTYTASEVGATSPTAVSNIVTTAYVREKLGIYLYVGEDGGIYVHTNEE